MRVRVLQAWKLPRLCTCFLDRFMGRGLTGSNDPSAGRVAERGYRKGWLERGAGDTRIGMEGPKGKGAAGYADW